MHRFTILFQVNFLTCLSLVSHLMYILKKLHQYSTAQHSTAHRPLPPVLNGILDAVLSVLEAHIHHGARVDIQEQLLTTRCGSYFVCKVVDLELLHLHSERLVLTHLLVLSELLQNVLGVEIPLHGLSTPFLSVLDDVVGVHCVEDVEVFGWNLEAVDKVKLLKVVAQFESLEDMEKGGIRRWIVEIVIFKQTRESLPTNTRRFKNCFNVLHVEGDGMKDAKVPNEVGAYNLYLDDEWHEGGCVAKLEAIAFKEDCGELFVHLAANTSNIQTTVFAEVFCELLLLMIRVDALGWSMDLVELNLRKESMESGLDYSKCAMSAPIVSLTNVAIRPDCCEAIDSVTYFVR